MTTTKIGLAGLCLIAFNSCSTLKPHRSIDLAYTPIRYDSQKQTNEIKITLDNYIETEIKNHLLQFGGTIETYMNFRKDYFYYVKLEDTNWS